VPGGQRLAALVQRGPEIEQHRAVAAIEQDVRGLEIAMDQAIGVDRRQPGEHVARETARPRRRDRAAVVELALERAPGQDLHHQEHAALREADVVDRDDVRRIDRRERDRLTSQPVGDHHVSGHVAPRALDRDRALELAIEAQIDLRHPAATE
jgi:hypothetical protein